MQTHHWFMGLWHIGELCYGKLGEQINFLDCDWKWKVPKNKKKESGKYQSFGFPGIPVILNSKPLYSSRRFLTALAPAVPPAWGGVPRLVFPSKNWALTSSAISGPVCFFDFIPFQKWNSIRSNPWTLEWVHCQHGWLPHLSHLLNPILEYSGFLFKVHLCCFKKGIISERLCY